MNLDVATATIFDSILFSFQLFFLYFLAVTLTMVLIYFSFIFHGLLIIIFPVSFPRHIYRSVSLEDLFSTPSSRVAFVFS